MNQSAKGPDSPVFIEQAAKMAMRLAQSHLADYGTARSRHDFTQHQLLACLVLRVYLKTTYRGVLDMLRSNRTVRRQLGLANKLPHYTTLQKFGARSQVQAIVEQSIATINLEITAQDSALTTPIAGTSPEWLTAQPANTFVTGQTIGATSATNQ